MIAEPAQLSDALAQIVVPDAGDLSPDHARYVLSLTFTAAQHAFFAELSAKAQDGALSADEQRTLDVLVFANLMLGAMQSKARLSLGRHQPAA